MKKTRINRREMIKQSLAGVAGFAMLPGCQRESRKQPSQSNGFKIGVCDWTLGKRCDPASLELAKRLGFDGVQVDFGGGADTLPLFDAERQKAFLAESQKQGIEIGSLAMGELNSVPYKSDSRAEQWVSEGIQVCKSLGCKVLLLACFGNGDLKNDPPGIDTVVERLKKVAPQAEQAGVTLGIESWLSAEEHRDILDRVDSPAIKVYYDVGNSHKMGYDIYQEIRALGERICEFHAKDYDDLYGRGGIDFPKVREAMDAVGYRGWLHIEGTQMPLGLEESCRYDLYYLRSIFPSVV
jgi:sugar phosphate isomerase/epimerase